MKSLDGKLPGTKRPDVAQNFLQTKIGKLEKRLDHQRAAGKTLDPESILTVMSDRVVVEMEGKLFRLKRLAELH